MLLFCFHHHYYYYCCCYFYSFVVAFYLFNVYILHHTYHQCIENYFSVYFLNFFFCLWSTLICVFVALFLREQEKPEKNKTMHKNAIVCFLFTLGMFDAFFLDSNSGIYNTQNFHTAISIVRYFNVHRAIVGN